MQVIRRRASSQGELIRAHRRQASGHHPDIPSMPMALTIMYHHRMDMYPSFHHKHSNRLTQMGPIRKAISLITWAGQHATRHPSNLSTLRHTVRLHHLKIHSPNLSIINARHPHILPTTSPRPSRMALRCPLLNIVLPYTSLRIINPHSTRRLTQMVFRQLILSQQSDCRLCRPSSSNRPPPHRKPCAYHHPVQLRRNHHYRTTHPHRRDFPRQSTVRLGQRQVTKCPAPQQ